jgi:hypothetical protein
MQSLCAVADDGVEQRARSTAVMAQRPRPNLLPQRLQDAVGLGAAQRDGEGTLGLVESDGTTVQRACGSSGGFAEEQIGGGGGRQEQQRRAFPE